MRELCTVLQRAVVFSSECQISAPEIALPGGEAMESDFGRPFRAARDEAVAAFEKGYVDDLLRRHSGNVTRALGKPSTNAAPSAASSKNTA